MKKSCSIWVLLALCSLLISRASAASPAEEIVDGVKQVKLTGLLGALAVYGPEAFTIVSAPMEGGTEGSVIAAGPYGKGRVVCLGHPGYLEIGATKDADTARLMSNLLLWSAHADPKQPKPLRVVLVDNKQLTEALAKVGFKVANVMPKDLGDSLSRCDVLLVRPTKLQKRDATRVLDFVKRGGGLMMADAGWIWETYGSAPGENLVGDFAGNLIGREVGITWSSRTVMNQDGSVPVTSSISPLLNAPAALDYLKAHPELDANNKESVQANQTMLLSVASAPSDDSLFIPSVSKVCEELKTRSIPGPKNAVSEKKALDRVFIAMETRRALQAPTDKPIISELAAVFPSLPPESAKPVDTTISIDTSHPRWHSTGLYARPGDVIEVTVPGKVASVDKKKLSLRIGCHKDRLWHADSWKRAPEIAKSEPISSAKTKMTSGFGGLIYIEVPQDCDLGTFDVKITGGLPAPRFVLGKTTNAEWKKIRTFPGPWAEIGSDKLIITVPSEAIREYDDPQGLMRFWDRVMDACAELVTIPADRPSAERIVVDAQISNGYLHAGYPIMGPLSTTQELLDLKTLKSKGNWGYYHEIGHNHQKPEWTRDGLGEVTVNLFSMYCLDTINPGAPIHPAMQPKSLEKMCQEFEQRGKLDGPFEQLMPYYQLKNAFGWQPFQKVFAEYRELPGDQKPKTVQERKDQWMIRFSKASNKNLAPFYDYWKIGVSEEAKKEVSSLPEWKPGSEKKSK